MQDRNNLEISLPEYFGSDVVDCFAVDGNFRINLQYRFDLKKGLLTINTKVDPRWLIVVDTVDSSFELEACLCL